ncbi:MAG: helix-turn-helix domain-containing protein [Peptostreptococcaceae bacterium]
MNSNLFITKCNAIYEFFNCDVYLFDCRSNVVFNITNINKYPVFFNDYIKNEVTQIYNKIAGLNTHQSYYFNSSYFLNFIAINIFEGSNYTYSVIIGPFLEDDFEFSTFVSKHSSELNKIGSYELVIGFYNKLSVYSFGRTEKLMALLYTILLNPLKPISVDYISNNELNYNNSLNPGNFDMDYWKMYQEQERLLMNSIDENNLEETIRILENMKFNYTSQSGVHTLPRVKYFLVVITSKLSRVAVNNNVPRMISYNLSARINNEIEKASSLSECNRIFTNLFKDYFELNKQYTNHKYSPLINKALTEINNNWNKSISLNDISNSLHISSAHLSRQFKLEVKMTITQYIHKTKINTAIQLMENKDISLLDISEQIGYINYSHFNKWFKKITGVTPKNYFLSVNSQL